MKYIEDKIVRLDDKLVKPLSEEDCWNLYCDEGYYGDFIKVNNTMYKVKHADRKLENELIGEEIAKYFNLQTVNNFLVSYNGEIMLLNKVFTDMYGDYGTVTRFPKVKQDFLSGLNNLDNLTEYYSIDNITNISVSKKSQKHLKRDILKMVVCDYLMGQKDRVKSNFLFSFNKDEVSLLPLFDYELSFLPDIKLSECNGYFNFNLKQLSVIEYIKSSDYIKDLLNMAMQLDMNNIILRVMEKGIVLTDNEKQLYIDCIKAKQEEIINSKVI